MDIISRENVKQLAAEHDGRCMSLFMPTVRYGNDTEQNPIRFKNLLKEAERRLEQKGVRPPERQSFLAPARSYLRDEGIWEHQSEGLAAFISNNTFQTFRVPITLEELVVDGTRFHTKPLLPLLAEDGRYFILALSLGNARLFLATHHSIDRVAVDDMPKGIEDTLKYDLKEKQTQTHSRRPQAAGERAAGFHGHDVANEDARKEIRRYCKDVDHAIRPFVVGEQTPIVLVAEDYLAAFCRDSLSYSSVVDEFVLKNPDSVEIDTKAIHTETWRIVKPLFETAKDDAKRRYESVAGKETASNKLAEVVRSAFDARVETLFAAVEEHQWGRYDRSQDTLEVHREERPDDEDLIDLAAAQTLVHGGKVFAVNRSEVPGGGTVAAVLRF